MKKAGDGTRTHDNDVGNVVLYHLSYTRAIGIPAFIVPSRGIIESGFSDARGGRGS